MGWNQTRPMGTGANRVGSKTGNVEGGVPVGITTLGSHTSGQQRIGPHADHPNQNNAKTGIRTSSPGRMGFKNRVERKG